MAYFNHAFHKVFLGTANVTTDPTPPAFSASVAAGTGFIEDAGVSTSALSQPGVAPGYFGVFNANTYQSIAYNAVIEGCCPFIIASSPIFTNDKIGPYAGGYRESNKSKMINPRYVRQFYFVEPCAPQQSVVSIGTTPGTVAGGNVVNGATACDALADGDISANNFQGGTTCGGCCKEYLCGETYYLRIDVKGSPALRFLNHQAYQTVSAYTGCCSGPAPVAVDPTLVYIEWAKAIYINPYIKDLILPVVFAYDGTPWYAPGTVNDVISGAPIPTHTAADGTPLVPNTWDTYAASQLAADWATETCSAGMRLFGAYVETKFGNCTFQVTDFFEKEPVKILASMVDYTGDPCTFEGVCVYTECYGVQGMGFGEQVLRDLIVSESYLQNYVGSGMDFRIREITQGYDIIDAVNRTALYGRYYILHSVPRYNNPTGVFDNDQYMLEIIVNNDNLVFEQAMDAVLNSCPDCVSLDVYECEPCVIVPNVPILL